ncbi:sensor domain-containing diguanylate cyclase, partial [Burkholderia ubonensis]|uniref:sensor domain-containing diguanylate cyclase n=1 Tax=Burkholderia ubonensis TaxID=101571 RepID=UPI00016A55F2
PDGAELAARCAGWLGREPAPFEITLADGRQLEMTRRQVPDGNAVIIVEDVTARRRAEMHIRHLARHDALTGLPNRHELHAELKRMLARRTRRHGLAPAVMYLDLDGFKAINDRFGHHAGDDVLTQVAARLSETLPQGELVARIGGDEFVVAIDDTTMQACSAQAAQIIRKISAPYTLSIGETVSLGISIGIALDRDCDAPEELIRHADSALYEAKSSGKGIYRFYSNGSRRVAPVAAG